MKTYKPYQVVLIVFFSMFANVGGRVIADFFKLPLWMDSFGTFFTAYTLGPICGAIVGVSGNMIHGLLNPISYVYSITAVFIAFIVGVLAARGWLNTLLKTMSLSVLVTLVCVLISVVLNAVFYDGDVGNVWGNSVVELFESWGTPKPVRIVLGQFYIDFLDKVFTLVALFIFIRVYRVLKPFLPKILKIQPALILLFLAIFIPQKTYASSIKEYNSYVHTIYNKLNGLPGSKANDIASTNDGILWIGTYEGLYRHNGHEFRLMTEFDSIKAVRCLYVDDEGRLFVGTNDNGLSIIINESIMNVIEEKDGLPADAIRSITRGSNGLYYVGTAEALAVLSNADGLGIVKTLPQIQTALTVSPDEKDHVAAVTAGGSLFIMTGTELSWSSSEISENFTAASFSPDGYLYASTESNRLMVFEVKENKAEFLSEIKCTGVRHINSISFYDDVMFLCADNGAGYVENGVYQRIETGVFNNSIDNMTEDYQGNLWFTSSRLGLLKMCSSSFLDVYALAELPESVVNSTARFNGNFYFATDNGLMAINSENGKALKNELTALLSNTRVRCLCIAEDGSMWIATKARGLVHAYTNGKIVSIGKGHQFRVARELADGTIAAGMSDGLAFVKNDQIVQWLSDKDGLENPQVLTLGQKDGSLILAGTDGGGLALISKEGEETSYSIKRLIKRSDGLSSNVILRTVNDSKDPSGVFVITSNSINYMAFDQAGNFKVKSLSNFPFSNNYDLVVLENNNVFVLSSAGIFVVNRDELLSGRKIDYELLDLKKGLRGSLTANSWNYIDEEGNLYLSCDTGASRINLNTYDKAEHSYRMQMKSVLIDGRRHIVQKDIPFVIPAETDTLEIVPEIINYSINTPYISLFFEGLDEKPSVMLQNDLSSVIYTNLRAGEYKFHIAVLDSKGRNILEESVYTIQKTYRMFDNWWFLFYILAVAMLAIIWLTWFIVSGFQERRMEKQRAEMESIRHQIRMGNETIFSIANAVEARDKSTGRHAYRVAEYAVLIARELGFTEEEQTQIRRTGLLHDIGKIGVPDSVLNKPAELNDEEYEIMKTHTIIGGEIMKDFTLIPHVDEGAKYHHERYDGTGYPTGLKGEEIPLNARIIGIADAFDAMTATRVYRKALDMDYVVSELKRCSGTQFDPGLVKIMLSLIASGKINVSKTVEESAQPETEAKR
ncbi:hypothetical protein MSI_11130 [Treponema sp. JC4]|uniref:HD domain-containing phosphohydrolase n=1 Tax=Treponema sp. JC4 TaxID=1124982 RepID=UPI00025AFBBB|nr:HD domain-containing phosphohydrolase [Treponema sp. JC4]EID85395.1 hypothetical protein MSI_11130 [Treponema sp. JC4]